jgi:hypothetical protein
MYWIAMLLFPLGETSRKGVARRDSNFPFYSVQLAVSSGDMPWIARLHAVWKGMSIEQVGIAFPSGILALSYVSWPALRYR